MSCHGMVCENRSVYADDGLCRSGVCSGNAAACDMSDSKPLTMSHDTTEQTACEVGSCSLTPQAAAFGRESMLTIGCGTRKRLVHSLAV